LAKEGHGLFEVAYNGVTVDLEIPYGVKQKADKGDERCENRICAMFREAWWVAQGKKLDHRVEFLHLRIEERAGRSDKKSSSEGGEGDLFDPS